MYSTLRGGGFSLLGSMSVHISMLIATWIFLEPMTNDKEYLDDTTRPRNLMLLFSLVHLLVAVV